MDAFYFTLVSLSTVGFGDLVPREHPPDAYGIYNLCLCQLKLKNSRINFRTNFVQKIRKTKIQQPSNKIARRASNT